MMPRFALHLSDLRRLFSSFSSRIVSTGLSFLVLLVASRALPTAEYGLYIFQFSVGSALGLIFVLGQPIFVVKHYRANDPDAAAHNAAVLDVNARWLVFGCGLLLTAAAVLAALSPRLPAPYDHLYVGCLFGAIFALSEYLQNYFRVHGEIGLSLAPREVVWRIASVVVIGALWWLGWLDGGLEAIIQVTFLLFGITAYQAVMLVRREGLGFWGASSRSDPEARRGWRTETFYFSANGFMAASSGYLETIVIGMVLGLEQAAFYFVALRFAMLLMLPVTAIDTVGVPLVSARFQANDIPGAQKLVGTLSAGSFAIALSGAAMLALVGPWLLGVFDASFTQHYGAFVVLCCVSVCHAFFGPGSWLIMIGGGERFFLISRTAMFVVYIGLLALLGYELGLVGIALAGLLFNLAQNLAATAWIMRRWRIDNMATAFFRPFALFDWAPSGEQGESPVPADKPARAAAPAE